MRTLQNDENLIEIVSDSLQNEQGMVNDEVD